MDDKISSLEAKFSSDELNAPIKNFELSRGCSKAMGLLDEELYMRVFLRVPPEKTLEEIVLVYKLFCQLLKKEDFVGIKDNKEFFEKFSKFILENKGDKLSEFCLKCVSEFNFDDNIDIEILKHECGKVRPANEIVNDMIEKNDIEVDAVSGATMSSEVIKAAVRDALRSDH